METDFKLYGLTSYQILKMKEHFDKNDLPYPEERPKRKVKKRFYMMAWRADQRSDWNASNALVDESFRDTRGKEVYSSCERKILENSPYIELEIETTNEKAGKC
jgi:hypothetical protein